MSNRKPNTICTICNTPIYRRPSILTNSGGKAYCSRECYGKSCQKIVSCIICNKEMLSSKHSKTCSKECFSISLADPNRKFCKGRKPYASNKYGSRSFKKKLIKERGSCCEICGYNKIPVLHIHHIIEQSNGGSDLASNLIILCPNCHGEVHAGLLDLLEFINKNID
jgi:5-methylcytosine-specific restriction protein A